MIKNILSMFFTFPFLTIIEKPSFIVDEFRKKLISTFHEFNPKNYVIKLMSSTTNFQITNLNTEIPDESEEPIMVDISKYYLRNDSDSDFTDSNKDSDRDST
jgi:hypothetical protein